MERSCTRSSYRLYYKRGHNLLVLEWYDPISVGLGTYTIKGRELDYIQAKGLGGQLINLVPELDLMVVFTCWAGPEDADIGGPLMAIYQAALND